ncbi:hypothetical protein SAMN04488103_109161 [Gemmobacter aquatilis]|uniref:Uncharacterized protein n=1 Tax=Gemmobacter aquatilis TaxID=933059 RepID=A0A1H8KQB8_9RHOB|nr:hypothetical protein [Gemmobacter aquatilis]SEN94806.1 hypothetical protein SAMN04488103_109161 [Gemmobacter aquatilis]
MILWLCGSLVIFLVIIIVIFLNVDDPVDGVMGSYLTVMGMLAVNGMIYLLWNFPPSFILGINFDWMGGNIRLAILCLIAAAIITFTNGWAYKRYQWWRWGMPAEQAARTATPPGEDLSLFRLEGHSEPVACREHLPAGWRIIYMRDRFARRIFLLQKHNVTVAKGGADDFRLIVRKYVLNTPEAIALIDAVLKGKEEGRQADMARRHAEARRQHENAEAWQREAAQRALFGGK